TLDLLRRLLPQIAVYLSCCRTIREQQGTIPVNPAGWNRSIPGVEATDHFSFVITSDEPQHTARPVENRISQRHPASSLINPRECDVPIIDCQDWISGYQGSCMPVRPEAEVNEIENRRRSRNLPESCRILCGCHVQFRRFNRHRVNLFRS